MKRKHRFFSGVAGTGGLTYTKAIGLFTFIVIGIWIASLLSFFSSLFGTLVGVEDVIDFGSLILAGVLSLGVLVGYVFGVVQIRKFFKRF